MATTITEECISCGACEPECPNNAIRQADPIYIIDPQLCTECVGFHDYEACAAVCPVDCCVPDPNIVETEEVLIARARALHQDTNFGDNFPSRFRKGDAEAKPAATAAEAASAEVAVEAGEPPKGAAQGPNAADGTAPVVAAATTSTADGEIKPAAAAAAPESTPAPPVSPSPAAAPTEPVAVKPQPPSAPAASGEMKTPAPVAKPVPRAAANDAQSGGAAKPPVKPEPRPKKTFPNELPVSFQELAAQYKNKRSGSLSKGLPKVLIILLQPVLGALHHATKKALEAEVQSPLFTAAGSTGLNILHNAILYPLFCMAFAALVHGPAIMFSQQLNVYLLIGIAVAVAEGLYRLKDGVFHLKSADEMSFPAAFYGIPVDLVVRPLLQKRSGVLRHLPIPVDGFYSHGFVDKLERERRYGNVYTLVDQGNALLLRMEFPRRVPEIGLASRAQLPDEMPDYEYDLLLKDRQLIVKGRCADDRVRKISSSIGAFPPEFTTVVPLGDKVVGFGHHFEDKCLEVLLVKDSVANGRGEHR